jgi:hypothetical protein
MAPRYEPKSPQNKYVRRDRERARIRATLVYALPNLDKLPLGTFSQNIPKVQRVRNSPHFVIILFNELFLPLQIHRLVRLIEQPALTILFCCR